VKTIWESVCNSLLKSCKCLLHVTSDQEAIDSTKLIRNVEPVVIKNGSETPEVLSPRSWVPGGNMRLLYIGRLNQIKGIENLLYALKTISSDNFSLAIYGTGDEHYSLSLRDMVRGLGLTSQVTFRGYVVGTEKSDAFANADVCIVPSYTENFGMVVVEALAHGVPVIASTGTPWRELENNGCGLWVDNSPVSLAESILRIRNMNLEEMGKRGREWVIKRYSWEKIALQMKKVYRRLTGEIQ